MELLDKQVIICNQHVCGRRTSVMAKLEVVCV